MKKIISSIIITLLLGSVTSVCFAKNNYTAFYGNEQTCDLLAKAGFEAYRHFGENHNQLLTFGSDDDKYNHFFDEKFALLKETSYIRNNSSLFPDSVIELLLKDGIYIWERSGNTYLSKKSVHYQNSYNLCMSPTKIAKKGD